MTPFAVVDGQHVKEEGLHIVVQGFVIQEKFGEKAKVLTVNFVDVAIHFEDGQVVLTVDFSGWRMPPHTLGHVPV